ncbi:MAG TPA: hypothetical protein VHC96_06895 [Puia sp.]|nr:hypothetical protein [Puia sp.]
MRFWVYLTSALLPFAGIPYLSAQRVMYCEPVNDRWTIRTELVGKVGDYYWMQSTHRRRTTARTVDPRETEGQTFDIYDARMKPVNTFPSINITDATQKEYLIPGDNAFDQLIVLGGQRKTSFYVRRFEPDGTLVGRGRILDSLPFNESGNSWLLVRSEDRHLILLLGFQSITSYPPKLHALLFDQDWHLLSRRVYASPNITQPFIQDDFTNYPLENYTNSPVKLADNGQWLMMSPSRTDANFFLLFHFNAMDSVMTMKQIGLPLNSGMEDVNLAIDNQREEVTAAILSTFHYDVLKNVHVVHYSMKQKAFDFDSSYRFSTLVPGKVRDENLTKESFIAVNGNGFMLLKEYGRPFTEWYDDEGTMDQQWDPSALMIPTSTNIPEKAVRSPALHDGYARFPSLCGLGLEHLRGDLGIFYFPCRRTDSCWSAMLSKEQITELNSPNLSYFAVPRGDRLFLLYNSFFRNETPYGSTTVLDPKGDVLSDAISPMFWKFKTILQFQQARQISDDEVVIPYNNYFGRSGFAVVKFGVPGGVGEP